MENKFNSRSSRRIGRTCFDNRYDMHLETSHGPKISTNTIR